jgi:hypothetical protein
MQAVPRAARCMGLEFPFTSGFSLELEQEQGQVLGGTLNSPQTARKAIHRCPTHMWCSWHPCFTRVRFGTGWFSWKRRPSELAGQARGPTLEIWRRRPFLHVRSMQRRPLGIPIEGGRPTVDESSAGRSDLGIQPVQPWPAILDGVCQSANRVLLQAVSRSRREPESTCGKPLQIIWGSGGNILCATAVQLVQCRQAEIDAVGSWGGWVLWSREWRHRAVLGLPGALKNHDGLFRLGSTFRWCTALSRIGSRCHCSRGLVLRIIRF